MTMDKLLIITPHLSTGGAPQFTLNKIELLKDSYETYCIEYNFVSPHYVVQRNKIIDLLGDKFKSLGENKDNLLSIINEINPNIISIEEFGETFIRQDILDKIYSNNRNYKILESTHSSHDNSNIKRWLPDRFIFVSEWSQKMYSHFEVDSEVIEYPIDKKTRDQKWAQEKLNLDPSYKHVLNVGLFTPGKNQGYAFDIARKFKDEKVLFHFIGNQAPNFKDYWEPIMKNKPDNCIVWGERDDVDTFIQASDLFLFTSKFELNPLVIKEVLCYEDIPIMMFNIETYMGNYDTNKNVKFLSNSALDINQLSDILKIKKSLNKSHTLNGKYDFIEIGTSDFDTIIENSNDLTNGISIEPIKYYLDRLPDKENIKKVNAAVSDKIGYIDIYFIEEEDIIKNNLPFWVRGCNSVNRPHPYVIEKIGEELYNNLVKVEKVRSINWDIIIKEYNVESIDYLKIDTEGHDHVILKDYLRCCKLNKNLLANKIKFEYHENNPEVSNIDEINKLLIDFESIGYSAEKGEMDIILTKNKFKKGYVLYSNDKYYEIVKKSVESIREYSELPIYVYMLNSDLKINIKDVFTIKWNCDIGSSENMYINSTNNFYINRGNNDIYKLLIQRPLIVKDVLEKYLDTVAYIDSDSIATPEVDNIFNFFNNESNYPYFVEGIYDYLFMNGRGGTNEDLTKTLEYPACNLFSIDQSIRRRYRQTGYFVSNKKCITFLEEWYWMCINPHILNNNEHYAPFNEETILNVLLWKKKILNGLPYIYINGNLENIDDIYDKISKEDRLTMDKGSELSTWVTLPGNRRNLLFIHGEKKINRINKMIEKIKELHV